MYWLIYGKIWARKYPFWSYLTDNGLITSNSAGFFFWKVIILVESQQFHNITGQVYHCIPPKFEVFIYRHQRLRHDIFFLSS